MKKAALAALTAARLMTVGLAHAQQPAAPPPAPPLIDWAKVQISDLGHNTYMLIGQGGNITVAVGSDASSWSIASSRRCPTRSSAAIKAISPCRSRS